MNANQTGDAHVAPDVSRRSILRGAAAVGLGGAAFLVEGPSFAVTAPPVDGGEGTAGVAPAAPVETPRGANGWPLLDVTPDESGRDMLASTSVPGTGTVVTLRTGMPTALLVYVAQRFHYELASLAAERLPLLSGFKPRRAGVELGALSAGDSNHASGTALDILVGWYPRGTSGHFTAKELVVVRDILNQCAGLVRWGGDSTDDPDEGHFEIAVGPDDPRLTDVTAPLLFGSPPDQVPGSDLPAPFRPERRKAADARARGARREFDQAAADWRSGSGR